MAVPQIGLADGEKLKAKHMLELYGYFRSSAAYRCRIAFNLKGVDYRYRAVHLRRGEQRDSAFLAANPHGLVPALVDGDFVLTQSLAIIEWLDETFPEPPFLPDDARTRARIRAFALSIACDIHPLQNLRVLKYLKSPIGCDQATIDEWARHWVGDGLAACDKMLMGLSETYCFGETPSVADIVLAPQLFSAQRFGVDISGMTRLLALQKTYEAAPAFVSAHPSKQPDWEE